MTKRIPSSIIVYCENCDRWFVSCDARSAKRRLPTTLRLPILLYDSHTNIKDIRSGCHTKKQWYYCRTGNSRNHLALNSSRKLTFLNSGWCRELLARSKLGSFRKARETLHRTSSVAISYIYVYKYVQDIPSKCYPDREFKKKRVLILRKYCF